MQIKQRLKPALVGCAVLMVAELQAGPGFTGEYQFTLINLPDTAQILVGPNDAGTVIGNYDGPLTSPCFLYGTRNGKWTVLPDVPGKPLSFPGSISNNGKALGYAFEDDFSSEVGWIWDGFSYSLFTLPGVEVFIPTAINNHAQVIGYYQDSLGSWPRSGALTIETSFPDSRMTTRASRHLWPPPVTDRTPEMSPNSHAKSAKNAKSLTQLVPTRE